MRKLWSFYRSTRLPQHADDEDIERIHFGGMFALIELLGELANQGEARASLQTIIPAAAGMRTVRAEGFPRSR